MTTSASWREEASAQTQADLDELLSASLGAALDHLQKNGEFYPFAMSVEGEGREEHPEVSIVFADPATLGEQPEAADVLAELRRILKVAAHNDNRTAPVRASAIVLQVVVPDFGDVVRVDLEHRDGIQLMVLAPITSSGKSRKRVYSFGDLRLLPGQQHIW